MKVKVNNLKDFKIVSNLIAKRSDVLSKNVAEQCVRIYTQDNNLYLEAMNASKYIITFELRDDIQINVIEDGNIFINAKTFEELIKPLNGLNPDNNLTIYTVDNELVLDLNSLGKRSKTFYEDIDSFPRVGLSQELEWEILYESYCLNDALKKAIKYVSSSESILLKGYSSDNYIQIGCKESNSGYLQLNIEEEIKDDFEFYISPEIAEIICNSSSKALTLSKSRLEDTFKVASDGVCIIFLSLNINSTDLITNLQIIDFEDNESGFMVTSKVSCNYKELLEAIKWQSADNHENDLTLSTEQGFLGIKNNLSYPAKIQTTSFKGEQFEGISFKTATLTNAINAVDAPNSCISLIIKSNEVKLDGHSIKYKWLILVPDIKYEGVFPKGIICQSLSS